MLQKFGGSSQGDLLISGATIIQSYLLLITGPLIGLSGGTQPLLSYNYGAKNIERVKQAEKYITIFALTLTTTMFFATKYIAPYFISLFTTELSLTDISLWGVKQAEKYITIFALTLTTTMFFATKYIAPYFISLFTTELSLTDISLWGIKMSVLAIIPLSFQYCFVDGFTAVGRIKTAFSLSMLRKFTYMISTFLLPIFFEAKFAFSFQYCFVDGFTAVGRIKTAFSLSMLRKFTYMISTFLLPIFFEAKFAFFAQPICDIVGSIASSIVFYLVFKKHLEKRLRQN